ncbi:MAG: methylmalonyl Co-A mutase-associated GTPase MeaB [Candidatus Marinimicrobia bacterium]|nr:methylmalonyl Co-A mutase-associated GTPase MeaB [Candidatus Neomarinimicrobiota bacterium]
MFEKLLSEIKKNNYKSISKAISHVENNNFDLINKISSCFPFDKKPHRVGITGPPGAGKSSITNLLIKKYRENNLKVAVLLVDPSSPFTKGAVLGDRIRMLNYYDDNNVFIRSFGSRGSKGGLSNNINEIADIFSLANYDIIIFETVGVGQIEIDVVEQVDSVILTLVPESGDDIQILKAGILEIADIFVVNKSDRSDSDKLIVSLKKILSNADTLDQDYWKNPILKTIAIKDEGIDELINELNNHFNFLNSKDSFKNYKIDKRYSSQVEKILTNKLLNLFWKKNKISSLNKELEKKSKDRISPYAFVQKLLNDK